MVGSRPRIEAARGEPVGSGSGPGRLASSSTIGGGGAANHAERLGRPSGSIRPLWVPGATSGASSSPTPSRASYSPSRIAVAVGVSLRGISSPPRPSYACELSTTPLITVVQKPRSPTR